MHTQCRHFFRIDTCCQSYVGQSKGHGVCAVTSDRGFFNGSRQAGQVCQHLEGVNSRQLGFTDCQRLSNSLCRPTCSTSKASHTMLSIRATGSDSGRNFFLERERGNICSGRSFSLATADRVLFESLPRPQEEWEYEASDKSESPEPVGGNSPLQNGGPANSSRPAEAGRLASQGGLERCLLHSSSPPRPPPLPEVCDRRGDLPVYLPSIWASLRPLGVHQVDENCGDSSQVMGVQDDYLHRRHPGHGRISYSGPTALEGSCSPLAMPRFFDQLREVGDVTYSGVGVSRDGGEHQYLNCQPARRQDQANSVRSNQNFQYGFPFSSSSFTFSGQTECSNPGCGPSSSLLSLPSTGPPVSTGTWQPGLRDPAVPVMPSQGGTCVVAGESLQVEWQATQTETRPDGHPVRCLPVRLGSSMQRDTHRRCLVSSGADHAYQLPGTPGSNTGSEDVHEGCLRDLSAPPVGQCYSRGVYQQPGGHSVESTDGTSERNLVVGPEQRHFPESPTYPRGVQHSGGCRIANPAGSLRLEALPSHLPGDLQSIWFSGSGPVCLQADTSGSPLLQLEARSSGRSSGCLSTGLGPTEGVCQPSLVPYRQSIGSSSSSASSAPSGSTSVEGSDLVSSAPGDVMGLPQADCSSSRSDPETNRLPHGDGPSTSRVACLRQRFSGNGLSDNATKLLLRSWRTKSAQSYDSHFRKWAGWCSERGFDPISGPASDVANFLADLFEQGYQSRSLNAFRSAISSVHDQVDGVAVGQHPTVCRLLKGAFHERPPLPRYTATWDVQTVIQYLESLGPTTALPLKFLTFKLVMLLALTRPSRSADLVSLQLDRRHFRPEGVVFLPAALAKQSAQGKPLKEYFFPSFPDNSQLCPVETLKQYEVLTAPLRPSTTTNLFIALVKPHKAVSSATIARWLREVLKLAGIDVSIFSGHSVRGASVSAAAGAGITTNDILKAADWSSDSVFRRFYYRPVHDPSFGQSVLSSGRANS